MIAPKRQRALHRTTALALAVPVAAWAWVDYRSGLLRDRVQAVAGAATVRMGLVDADLTGRICISDIALGAQFKARAVEASVALPSLLAGKLSADEIRVDSPHIAVRINANGDSDLADLVRRFQRGRPNSPPQRRSAGPVDGIRRILVSAGAFIAHIDGFGEVTATQLQLIPDARGARLITGPVHVHGDNGELKGELDLARGAAEIALPQVSFERVLAVAGHGRLGVQNAVELHDVSIGRLAPEKPFEIHAALDDGGTPRDISATLDSHRTLTVWGERVPLRSFAGLAPRALSLTNAYASGTLTVAASAPGAERRGVRVQVDGQVDGARLDHSAIGPQPIALSGAVRGALTWSSDEVVIDNVAVDIGISHWTASAWWRRRPTLAGNLDLSLAQAPCSELFAALPIEIRSAVDGLAMTGTLGGRAHLAVDLAAPLGDGVALTTEIANHCTVTAEATAGDPTRLATQSDHTFPDGSRARVGPGTDTWTELQRIPRHVVAAFVSAEDGRFYDHHGFDPVQIGKSFEIDLRDRKLTRGGSTISQQLVKNSFLNHRRSLDRKLQEAILTWRLEDRLSKTQILERYLNVIELGPHVFGIHTAARYWFGTSAHELGVRQGAFLAALTSEPQSMSQRIRLASGLDPESAARVDVILAAMFRDGAIDKPTFELARKLPLRFAPAALRQP